jgi:hypothetical protein
MPRRAVRRHGAGRREMRRPGWMACRRTGPVHPARRRCRPRTGPRSRHSPAPGRGDRPPTGPAGRWRGPAASACAQGSTSGTPIACSRIGCAASSAPTLRPAPENRGQARPPDGPADACRAAVHRRDMPDPGARPHPAGAAAATPPMGVPRYPHRGIVAPCRFVSTRPDGACGAAGSNPPPVPSQAIARCIREHNAIPKRFRWTRPADTRRTKPDWLA